MSKSHLKHDTKISAQSSQIQNLRNKLDATVAEKSQMCEYLHPSTLQTAVTNALQAAQSNLCGCGGSHGFTPREGRSFLGQPREPQLSAGKDGTTDPDKTCKYSKDSGHELGNCIRLQRKKDLQAHHQAGQGSN